MYELTVHQVPVSLNRWQSCHWAERAKMKELWAWEMFALLKDVPKNLSHVTLSAEIFFDVNRRRDADNYTSVLWKMTQDALVQAKVIPDDTPNYITTGTVDLRIDKGHPRTVIRMEVTR